MTAHKVLREDIDILGGKEKVIVVGGGMLGCETAEFVSKKSKGQKKVIVVEMLAELGSDGDTIDREFLIQRLCEKRDPGSSEHESG